MHFKINEGLWTVARAGCYVCGSAHNLIASGVTIEGEGQLALCGAHLHDMALVAGWLLEDPAERERLQADVEAYRLLAAEQAEKATLAEQRWEHYRDAVADVLRAMTPPEPAVERPKNLRDPKTGKLVKRAA